MTNSRNTVMKKQNVKRELMDKVIEAIERAQGNTNDSEQLIMNRKYILATAIEIFSGWSSRIDSLPEIVQIGAINPIWIRLIPVNEKMEPIE